VVWHRAIHQCSHWHAHMGLKQEALESIVIPRVLKEHHPPVGSVQDMIHQAADSGSTPYWHLSLPTQQEKGDGVLFFLASPRPHQISG
ncbi:MAG: hypothetical protein KAX80_10955, partial [Planctomycetes bacterium]|nr:hypothetical protein [Planctomycetota bacterium]